jgi:hypothetical protein
MYVRPRASATAIVSSGKAIQAMAIGKSPTIAEKLQVLRVAGVGIAVHSFKIALAGPARAPR